jgi:starch phosphorylase
MRENGQPFAVALALTRAGNLFTTHTAVQAGFDRFPAELMERHLGRYAREELGVPFQEVMALGRANAADDAEPFNMAYLAVRGSGAVNGVSRLHGEVSRRLFMPLFPRWPEEEVPIGFVTNGVHMPTWESVAAEEFWRAACGGDRWQTAYATMNENFLRIPDESFWKLRCTNRRSMVAHIRSRLPKQLAASGAPAEIIKEASQIFDPNILTLGFARRFAAYKRPDLLLHDRERLVRILSNPQHPVQLVIAGKAHPADLPGQELIRQWIQFLRQPEVRAHVVFLDDYDMLLAQRLVQGVDVWINTPQRPWEASGTSGMKVLVNGGVNISELDGWWAEAYQPELGWALGDGRERGYDPSWNAAEANAFYDLLEREITPEFYGRDERGIPQAWVARMRQSMLRLTPQYSSGRSVREYTEKYYLPAATRYRQRCARHGASGVEFGRLKRSIAAHWSGLGFGAVSVETPNKQHMFTVEIYTRLLDPKAIRIELFASAIDSAPVERQELRQGAALKGNIKGYEYFGSVPALRPSTDYTVRILPSLDGATVPLEADQILWQR